MGKWNIWHAPAATRSFKLHLIIRSLQGLSVGSFPNHENSNLTVQIEWKGHRKQIGVLFRRVGRSCTSKQCIQSDGTVNWHEGFDHVCKLRVDSQHFRCWIINFEVHGCSLNSNNGASILAKALLDIAKFASPGKRLKRTIRIPVNYEIAGSTAKAGLTVSLELYELQTNRSTIYPLAQTLLLPSLSCIRCSQLDSNCARNLKPNPEVDDIDDGKFSPNQSTDLSLSDSSSDDETEFEYRNLAATNLLVGPVMNKVEHNIYNKGENLADLQSSHKQPIRQPSLVRLLSWNRGKLSFREVHHPRDTPLLNKANGEGGDDIDNDRRHQIQSATVSQPRHVQLVDKFHASGFEDEDSFEVGAWEKKKLISRDRQMELDTEVFLASIDQCSEKAAGAGACTVLVNVITDWLHRNPKTLPLRCQFDNLIREGSSEWRNLCADENHKEKFSDQHFDLDTVLEAKVRLLSVVPEMSYVGFFVLENNPDRFEFLQGAMSFDSIWEELLSTDASEEQIYIVSWNDHFFVLKAESDAIYIIDTLGERLFEGCNQAYILKFNRESRVYRLEPEPNNLKVESKGSGAAGSNSTVLEADDDSSREILCEGKASCKEFIKGFLAALPLRELQDDVERGLIGNAPLHHRLQIEFHYTAPY